MAKAETFSAKMSSDLKKLLDEVCKRTGLRKQFVVEEALREKLEDILDSYDLRESIEAAGEFYPWNAVKKQMREAT